MLRASHLVDLVRWTGSPGTTRTAEGMGVELQFCYGDTGRGVLTAPSRGMG
jgi:hypothetical protein